MTKNAVLGDRGLCASKIVYWQFIGAVIGGFFRGWFRNRFGRRTSAVGFFLGELSVLFYLAFLSAVAFIGAGLIWFLKPETVGKWAKKEVPQQP